MIQIRFAAATGDDAAEIAALRNAVTEHLTQQFGVGHWSARVSEKSVLNGMRHARIFIGRRGSNIVATLRLATKRPWAIDPKPFTAVRRPLYLTDMAVHPDLQRKGVGRGLMKKAAEEGLVWLADAIRLDAYDASAGAGSFYAKCGYIEVGRVTYRGTPLVYYERLLRDGFAVSTRAPDGNRST